MSLTKRIWIERDPAYGEEREKYMTEAHAAIAASPHAIPGRRKNRPANSPHWDPVWPRCLRDTAREVGAKALEDCIYVNSRLKFRSAELRDKVKARAEQLWAERLELRRPKRAPSEHEEFFRKMAAIPLPKAVR